MALRDLDKAALSIMKSIPGQNEAVTSLFMAAIAEQHIAFIGPPGEAKSLLARKFAASMEIPNSTPQYFERMLTRTSTLNDLFGPVSIVGLKTDQYIRSSARHMQSSTVSFVDEVFNGNSAILNSMLSIMNERTLDGVLTPLELLIGASNNLPDGFRQGSDGMPTKINGDGLGALWDRFSLRVFILPLTKESDMKRAIVLNSGVLPADKWDPTPYRDELKIRIGKDDSWQDFMRFIGKLEAKKIVLSTRRKAWVWRLLHAAAILKGKKAPDVSCFRLVANAVWTTEDQLETARDVAGDMQDPATSAYKAILRNAKTEFKKFESLKGADKTIATGSTALAIGNKIKEIRELNPGFDTSELEAMVTRIKAVISGDDNDAPL